MKWVALSPQAIADHELGTLLVIARPDGKMWSGVLVSKSPDGFVLGNGNTRTYLSFARNPTASHMVVKPPKWELGFGDAQLQF